MTTDTADILPIVGAITLIPAPATGRWSVADYEQLPDDGPRYEIIEGVLRMPPAPILDHQFAGGTLFYQLFRIVQIAGLGRVLAAPTDVELAFETIIQPDVLVVLNDGAATLTRRRVVGPPDLIVEITSPSTASYDRREKRDAYAAAGVREYWIADPASRSVELFILDGDAYRPIAVYTASAIIPSSVIAGWDVPTGRLFAD